MREMILEIGGYGLVSAAALALDAGVLTLLVKVAGWPYLIAAVVSFIAGGVLLYALSTRFVFHPRARRLNAGVVELSCFIGLGTVGLLVNTLVMYAAVTGFALKLLYAKLCAAACTFGVNFLLRRQLLFARSH
jgi:putative flippase GtrA